MLGFIQPQPNVTTSSSIMDGPLPPPTTGPDPKEALSVYHHYPLTTVGDFRLLELAPGQPSDPLIGKLYVQPLKPSSGPPYCGPYMALSYVWGPPNRTHWIDCGVGQIFITETLDSALRHVRRPTKETMIWVDQICINQNDLAERGHQVDSMKLIYKGASKVISWLGPDNANQAPLAKTLIERFDNSHRGQFKTVHFPTDRQLKALGLPQRESPEWAALDSLLCHQYFERVWVLQEVRLGSEVLLRWGETDIPWNQVFRVFVTATGYWMQIADPQANARPCPTLSLERLEAFMMSSTTWVDLLRATRRFGATDLRDKVFALSGLVIGDRPLTSDYTISLGETYAKATKHVIDASGSLQVLAYVWIRDMAARDGVPTWAPRWYDIADVNMTPKVLADWASYSASGWEKARLKEDSEWGVLALEGLNVDEVDCVAPLLTWQGLENSWWRTVSQSLKIADPAGRLQEGSPEDLIIPLLWTITAGQSLGVNGLTCPATDPRHVKDFVAFAFNGLLQNWVSDGDNTSCLKELLNLIDCALRSLPSPERLDEGVYDDVASREGEQKEPETTDVGNLALADDELVENQPPDENCAQDSGGLNEEKRHDSEALEQYPLDDALVELRRLFDAPEEVSGGESPSPEYDDDSGNENISFGELATASLPFSGAIHEDSHSDDRLPLEIIHQDDSTTPTDEQDEAPLMSRAWIQKSLQLSHPSDPSAVDAAIHIVERAQEIYETGAVIRFMSQFEVSSINRRFFVTKKGYMGIGPAYMEEGDTVCVLFGGPTPYVLRPLPRDGEYQFLGECYVDDLMNGEALSLLEKGRRETQWFKLR